MRFMTYDLFWVRSHDGRTVGRCRMNGFIMNNDNMP